MLTGGRLQTASERVGGRRLLGASSLSAIQLTEWRREQEQKRLLLVHNFYFEIKHNRRREGKEATDSS